MLLAAAACASASSERNQGSTIFRQIEVQERVSGRSARKSAQPEDAAQSATVARFFSERWMSAFRPPMPSAHFRPSSASSTASIEGVVMVSPLKTPSISLQPLVRRKRFGSGQAGGGRRGGVEGK